MQKIGQLQICLKQLMASYSNANKMSSNEFLIY